MKTVQGSRFEVQGSKFKVENAAVIFALPSSIVSPLSAACSLRPATVIFCFHLPYSINSPIAGSRRKMWYNNVV
jgi:hypothetical protein